MTGRPPTEPATTECPTVVFLDRDGTLIHDVHYLSRPEEVRLLDGVADAIGRLNRAGIPVILVTNQSGIGRGYFTAADYERVHAKVVQLLAEHGAHLDGTYYCPHSPEASPPCSCRKPSPELFQRAIRERHLDPSRPVFIGDRWRDLAAMAYLGGRGILIPSPNTGADDLARTTREAELSPSLGEAVDTLLGPPVVPRHAGR